MILGLLVLSSAVQARVVEYEGDILYFTGDPHQDEHAVQYIPDGGLLVEDGYVINTGKAIALKDRYHPDRIIDYRGKIISPGFVDTHVHYSQVEMTASYGKQLLGWLNDYVFPAEMKFSDPAHASRMAKIFLHELLNNGTTTAMVFATSNPISVDALFQEALVRNMRIISGKVLMDRNAPQPLLDTPETAYQHSKALIEKWGNKGRLGYAVTPRFAPTSSDAELKVAGQLLREYPDVWMQTHLAENQQEMSWVRSLFPHRLSYLDIYRYYGLITRKSVFAHSVHLSGEDFGELAKGQGNVAFCPLSNLFLGSGLFNLQLSREHQIQVGLGTDVGGGTSLSMLKVMGAAYNVTQLRKAFSHKPDDVPPLDPMENWYMATLGGAKVLALENVIGSFSRGKEADFIVLDPHSNPLLQIRTTGAASITSTLFALEMMGDEGSVMHTYLMGEKVK
jgi:guanine deaminase